MIKGIITNFITWTRSKKLIAYEGRRENGSFTAELVVLAPILLAVGLVIVACSRVDRASGVIQDASRAAAETAVIQSTPGAAEFGAKEAAAYDIERHHILCGEGSSVQVDLGEFHAGGDVTVKVTCTVKLSDVALIGLPGSYTMSATDTMPVDPYAGLQP